MELKEIFSQRLKNARIRKQYSYRALSDAINNVVSSQTLSNYEQGLSFPDHHVMPLLAEALDVKIDTLFKPFSIDRSEIKLTIISDAISMLV